jgi:6-phosphofructo-2-kinase/fructose-2,6-biphosphatase 4
LPEQVLSAATSANTTLTYTSFLSQSGQSLIEHSYKADSDLSPAGWEYAERLRAAVIARRKQVAEEKKARGEEWKDRKLVVSFPVRALHYGGYGLTDVSLPVVDLDVGAKEGTSYCLAVCAFGVQGRSEAPDERDQPVSSWFIICVLLDTALTECTLLFSGVWDGLSTEEAKAMYPDEWERFLSDPYAHRAPRAESYHDLSGMSFPFYAR